MRAQWQNFHLHPLLCVGPNLHENVYLLGAWWVGGVVVFFGFFWAISLGPKPSLFLLVCLGFFVFFGVFFLVWFLFVFGLENKTNLFFPKRWVLGLFFSVSRSFSLACLSLSLSLSLSLFSLFLSSFFLVFFLVLFWLSCFGVYLSCLVSAL